MSARQVLCLVWIGSMMGVGAGAAAPARRPTTRPPAPVRPAPTPPTSPRRFLAVTRWYGTVSLELAASGTRTATQPHDGVTDRWRSQIGTSCHETLELELGQKTMDDDPTGALWSGKLKSVDAQVRHWSNSEHTSAFPEGPPRIEKTTSETRGSQRFTQEAPARLELDTRKGVYDFDATGAFQMMLQSHVTTDIREPDGMQRRSAGDGEIPAMVGKTIAPSLAFPMYLGPTAPDASAIPRDAAGALAMAQNLGKLRFKLPNSGMVLRGETSVPLKLALGKAPWEEAEPTQPARWVMRWTFTPQKARLLMEPTSEPDYDRWIPAPADDPTLYPDAKPLDFRARFEPATGGPPPSGLIRFNLRDVSEHPGNCQNDPPPGNPNAKPDIRFALQQAPGIRRLSDKECETAGSVREATVRIEATDTGGFAHLTCESPNLGIQGKWKSRIQINLPRDDNGNEIADAWDQQASGKGRSADDEPRNGQAEEGDGIPLSDEYRGYVIYERDKKVFRRTNPKEKDVFVLVENARVGPNREVDLDMFQKYTSLTAHEVRRPNVGIDASLRGTRRVDINDDGSSIDHTYALRINFRPWGPEGLIDLNLADADPRDLDPNARAYTAGAGPGGDATPLHSDLIMVFPARIQNVADFFYNLLDTALVAPNTPYPRNGASLGSRLSQLPPGVRARAQQAVDLWKRDRESVTRHLAEDTTRMAVLHEMIHSCGINHHDPQFEGPESYCLIRYFTVAQEWEICINSATTPGWKQDGHNYRQVCRGRSSQCWEAIRTAP